MGKPILLLRLEAPLQSWGTRSRWDVRDTASEPTKSGIIGLLGCALGYSMRDPRLEQLNEALRFGVRVEHPGRVIVDYQTITDFLPTAAGEFKFSGGAGKGPPEKLIAELKEPATIQSPRAYIEDGAFLVALEATDGNSAVLDDCVRSIQQPRWPLFLGRKACVPTRPIFQAFTDEYDDIEDALSHHPWSWLWSCLWDGLEQRPAKRPPKLEVFVERLDGASGPRGSSRQDAVRINAARLYGFCTIQRLTVDFPDGSEVSSSSNQPIRSH